MLESSLIRWVALRGALTQLYVSTIDEADRALPFYPSVELVMGVGHVGSSFDDPAIDVAPAWQKRLSGEQ
jgi:hypothetical protein